MSDIPLGFPNTYEEDNSNLGRNYGKRPPWPVGIERRSRRAPETNTADKPDKQDSEWQHRMFNVFGEEVEDLVKRIIEPPLPEPEAEPEPESVSQAPVYRGSKQLRESAREKVVEHQKHQKGVGHSIRQIMRNRRGTAALEMGLFAPVLVTLMLGTFNYGVAIVFYSRLEFAAEGAARCWGLDKCTNPEAVAYADTQAGIEGATFHADDSDGCGRKVTGSYSFNMITMFPPTQISVSACYPPS